MAAGDSREAVGAALRSQTQARLRDRFLFRPPRAVSRRRPVEGPALSRGRKRRSSPCRDRSRRRKAARGGVLARRAGARGGAARRAAGTARPAPRGQPAPAASRAPLAA